MFRNPPTTNFRALRDMGLGAWWGMSLMNLAGLLPAARSKDDPKESIKIHDAGLKGSRGLQAGSVAAYLVGTSLERFEGKPLSSKGVPRWMTEGPESATRSLATAVALGAAVGAKKMREQAIEAFDRHNSEKGESLRKQAHAMHAVIPAAVGWLLYSHLKEDMRETSSGRLFGLL